MNTVDALLMALRLHDGQKDKAGEAYFMDGGAYLVMIHVFYVVRLHVFYVVRLHVYHAALMRVVRNAGMVWLNLLPTHIQAGLGPSDVLTIAALHDTLEDTTLTLEAVRNSFKLTPTQLEALELLSANYSRKDLTYQQWIDKIIASGNLIAIIVKLADNMDNMDPYRIETLAPEERGRIKRYQKSSAKLTDALRALRAQPNPVA